MSATTGKRERKKKKKKKKKREIRFLFIALSYSIRISFRPFSVLFRRSRQVDARGGRVDSSSWRANTPARMQCGSSDAKLVRVVRSREAARPLRRSNQLREHNEVLSPYVRARAEDVCIPGSRVHCIPTAMVSTHAALQAEIRTCCIHALFTGWPRCNASRARPVIAHRHCQPRTPIGGSALTRPFGPVAVAWLGC